MFSTSEPQNMQKHTCSALLTHKLLFPSESQYCFELYFARLHMSPEGDICKSSIYIYICMYICLVRVHGHFARGRVGRSNWVLELETSDLSGRMSMEDLNSGTTPLGVAGQVTGYIATVLCLATASSDVDACPFGYTQ